MAFTPHRKKKLHEATTMFEKCTKYDPHHPYVTNNHAYVYILMKKYKEAAEVCAEACKTNMKANNYFRNWAVALLMDRQHGEAIEIIKRAIDIEPTCAGKST